MNIPPTHNQDNVTHSDGVKGLSQDVRNQPNLQIRVITATRNKGDNTKHTSFAGHSISLRVHCNV